MERNIRFIAVVFLALALCACGRGGKKDIFAEPYTPSISSPTKIRVLDVSNDTHQVFDVDIIGLLWNGMEDSLKKRGMFWTPQNPGARPVTIEAHVVEYRKGSQPWRLLPKMGDVVLSVKCELKEGDATIAHIEVKRKITYGSKLLTRRAWKEIFGEVSEEIISQAVRRF